MRCFTLYCLNDTEAGRKHCPKCRSRKYRQNNALRAAYISKKADAKRRFIDFNWTFEEFKKFCRDTNYMKLRGKGPDDLVIDRLKVWIGYQPDNVQVLTQSENSRKARKEPRSDPSYNPFPNTPF